MIRLVNVSKSFGTHRNGYAGGKYMHLSALMPGYNGNIYVIVDISNPAHPFVNFAGGESALTFLAPAPDAAAGAGRTDTAYPRMLRWASAAQLDVIPEADQPPAAARARDRWERAQSRRGAPRSAATAAGSAER